MGEGLPPKAAHAGQEAPPSCRERRPSPATVRTHITMAVPPEPGLGRGAREAHTLAQGQPGSIMGTPRDKRSAAQSLEPDAARIPLLEQRMPRPPRWNPPQGESPPNSGDQLTLGPTGSRGGDSGSPCSTGG